MLWLLLLLIAQQPDYSIAAGNPCTTYYSYTAVIDSSVTCAYPNSRSKLIQSQELVQILARLFNGDIDYAGVHSNDLSYVSQNRLNFPYIKKRARAIAALFDKPIPIVVCKDLNIKNLVELSKRRMNLRLEGSGAYYAAQAYYDDGIFYRKYYGKLQFVIFLVICAGLFGMLATTFKPRIARLAYIKLIRAMFIFLIIWFIGAYAMYALEGSVNENFGSISESFWSIATYLLSGLEDRNPINTPGRVISFLILAIGIGTVAFITAEVASIFTQNKMRKEANMQGFKDHIILCNWSERGEKILKELFSPISPLKDSYIGIITDKEQRFSSIPEKYGDHVQFILGDPRSLTCLRKAGVPNASAVIILALDEEGDPDGASAQVLLALRELLDKDKKDSADRRPRLMVEVLDSRNREILKDAGADIMICGEDFAIGMLAQSAIFPGMTKIYDELLDYSGENNEFYVIPIHQFPGDFVKTRILGRSFIEISEMLLRARSEKNPAILVGVKKDSQVILNPRRQEIVAARQFMRFAEGDSLIVIAYEKPNPRDIAECAMGAKSSRDIRADKPGSVRAEPSGENVPFLGDAEDQIVICNWNLVGEKIIEELHDVSSPARNNSIIVLSDEIIDDRAYVKKHAFKENVIFLAGRTTNKNVLKKLGAHRSRSVIVLAPDGAPDADGANTLALLALRRLIKEELSPGDRKPNVLVEALNHRKREVLIGAGAREIISRDDFTMSILAQSCIYPQISDIFNELLDYDDDSNEIYISPWEEIPKQIREELVGKSFVELAEYFSGTRNPMNPSLLVGQVRGEAFALNPRDGFLGEKVGEGKFREGDGLIFLSYKRPDFNVLIGEA